MMVITTRTLRDWVFDILVSHSRKRSQSSQRNHIDDESRANFMVHLPIF